MRRRAAIAVATLVLAPVPAAAQSCNFSISNVVFTSVDVLSGAADITANLNISCTGLIGSTIRICPSIGTGTGGATASARQMTGPGTLNYQLYSDLGRTTVWGSYGWGLPGTPPTIDLTLPALGTSGSTTRTIYARVLAGQPTAPVGTYTSNFTTVHTNFVYATATLLPCPNLLLPQVAQPTFMVEATLDKHCLVSAQNIDFGTQGVLTANVDKMADISVTCTAPTSYTVGLDGGNAAAAPAARKMQKGAEQITYGLYSNGARTQPWGNTVGTDTVGGTGNGLAQPLTVYGRVPPQVTPTPGVYTDSIVVTVTY